MAFPGSIHNPEAKGCHALIKEGARLIESADEIMEDWLQTPYNEKNQQKKRPLTAVVLNRRGKKSNYALKF